MSDEPVSTCTTCGASATRVLHPPAVHFKGSGFYTTDYGKKARSAAADGSADGVKKDGDSGAAKKDGDSGAAKKAESTSATKAGSSAKAGSGSSDS